MKVRKENVRQDSTSCNFCQKGKLNINKNGLIYPYETVVSFSRENGAGLCACICEECLDELYKKSKTEFSNEQTSPQNPPSQQTAVSGSAWLMEIYDNSRPKEPKRIAAMEYPSKEAEKIKKKIDKGGTQYTYKLVY